MDLKLSLVNVGGIRGGSIRAGGSQGRGGSFGRLK